MFGLPYDLINLLAGTKMPMPGAGLGALLSGNTGIPGQKPNTPVPVAPAASPIGMSTGTQQTLADKLSGQIASPTAPAVSALPAATPAPAAPAAPAVAPPMAPEQSTLQKLIGLKPEAQGGLAYALSGLGGAISPEGSIGAKLGSFGMDMSKNRAYADYLNKQISASGGAGAGTGGSPNGQLPFQAPMAPTGFSAVALDPSTVNSGINASIVANMAPYQLAQARHEVELMPMDSEQKLANLLATQSNTKSVNLANMLSERTMDARVTGFNEQTPLQTDAQRLENLSKMQEITMNPKSYGLTGARAGGGLISGSGAKGDDYGDVASKVSTLIGQRMNVMSKINNDATTLFLQKYPQFKQGTDYVLMQDQNGVLKPVFKTADAAMKFEEIANAVREQPGYKTSLEQLDVMQNALYNDFNTLYNTGSLSRSISTDAGFIPETPQVPIPNEYMGPKLSKIMESMQDNAKQIEKLNIENQKKSQAAAMELMKQSVKINNSNQQQQQAQQQPQTGTVREPVPVKIPRVFPTTQEGFSAIPEFKDVINKVMTGVPLTEEEKQLYNAFVNAAQ